MVIFPNKNISFITKFVNGNVNSKSGFQPGKFHDNCSSICRNVLYEFIRRKSPEIDSNFKFQEVIECPRWDANCNKLLLLNSWYRIIRSSLTKIYYVIQLRNSNFNNSILRSKIKMIYFSFNCS